MVSNLSAAEDNVLKHTCTTAIQIFCLRVVALEVGNMAKHSTYLVAAMIAGTFNTRLCACVFVFIYSHRHQHNGPQRPTNAHTTTVNTTSYYADVWKFNSGASEPVWSAVSGPSVDEANFGGNKSFPAARTYPITWTRETSEDVEFWCVRARACVCVCVHVCICAHVYDCK